MLRAVIERHGTSESAAAARDCTCRNVAHSIDEHECGQGEQGKSQDTAKDAGALWLQLGVWDGCRKYIDFGHLLVGVGCEVRHIERMDGEL